MPTHPFVKVRPGHPTFVQFLSPPEDIFRHLVHWLDAPKKTVPCLGEEECRWCHFPKREEHYAPVIIWKASGSTAGRPTGLHRWEGGVLRITENMASILSADHRLEIVEVFRLGNYNNSPLGWRFVEKIPEAKQIDIPPFDVIATVEKFWGMYAKLKKVEVAELPDGATIPFPGAGERREAQ